MVQSGKLPATATALATQTTVREATIELFRSLGVTKLFGNPGSTELPFLNRWPNDIQYVLGLQEASVVAMADGYARKTGRASIVNVHSAAGLGHALGNVYTAYRNKAPMVIIAGQQARELLPNLPFLGASEATTFPRPYVKYAIEPARAEDVPAAIAHAYRVAMQRPQGPTFVSVPVDDWDRPCAPVRYRTVSEDFAPDIELIRSAAAELARARNPIIVAGAEVDEENAGPALVSLAEKLNIPVLTAPFASRIAFPEDHPLFQGFLPAAPSEVSARLIKHDAILVVGAPVFTYHIPGASQLIDSDVSIIHLTTDGEAAASAPIGTSIIGSLRFSLPALEQELPAGAGGAVPQRGAQPVPKKGKTISPHYFFHRFGQILPPEALLMEESPSYRPIMQQHVQMREWGSFFTMASGGLGYGLPGAVGLAFAEPDKRVVCLIGDGSFMYSAQALWTATQHDQNLCVILLNNSGYGAMRSFSRVLNVSGVPGIDFQGLDFMSLSKGMGCKAKRATTVMELDEMLEDVVKGTGPTLLEVVVDSEVQSLYD
ncbi:benzoylformate decarboxylase [Agrobacterium tumefaciens]|uniref:Benzoylformate decarboxylase n=1 Tax=Agrobacterium tumefaciens TaxID=358 RepID=A0A2L2LM36_AGRTU|nr:benzoylformate decarboxylase [Agrobacterium tumefaciens]AVH45395.1 benzoylformate decarboxylase [Agrobacterium tumefaciens]NSY99124.1 benzoylformate decarboxylase [Agrobacterium tumefaciens]